MAKNKQAASVQNRPIYSRISYLYQAASYLSTTRQDGNQSPEESTENSSSRDGRNAQSPIAITKQAMSRRLLSDLRASSHKSQIRLTPSMKHTICKYCDTLLIEGDTSTSTVENQSKGGKKPWADVLVVKCDTCGGLKRFPVQAPRQKRRPARETAAKQKSEEASGATAQGG